MYLLQKLNKFSNIKINTREHSPINHSRIVGSKLGRISKLSGYQKHHHVPVVHSNAAQNFVRKSGHLDVKKAADSLYADIRRLFGYKRREFEYTCEDGYACIKTPDFDLLVRVDQCKEEVKNYSLSTEIVALHNDSILTDQRFHDCFTHQCEKLIIELAQPIKIEDKIDALEDLQELSNTLTYRPDCKSFELSLSQLDLLIEVFESQVAFRLLTMRNLGKLIDHSQKAFDIMADSEINLRLV